MVIRKLLIIHLVSKNFFYLGLISFGLFLNSLGFAQTPSNGQVSAGSASISQQANQTTINQTSSKAIIDWRSFSIGADNRVVFVQPNSSAITLNRVTGKEASVINGSLLANGHVWLLNSNGILIGKTGQVSVGSFLGSTQSLTNEKFLVGDYRFSPNPNSGSLISNQGKIIVKDGGYAVLSGEAVRNDGYIQANLGQVVLAGSKSFAIDLSGDRMISFAVTEPLEMIPADGRAVVDNTGILRADGGQVLLTARSAAQLIGQVINTSGLISAASASLVNGSIVLDGGTNGSVTVSGNLDASGKNAQEKGGAIDVMGQHLSLTSSAVLDVSGDLGGGIIQIGGSWQGAANQYSPAVTNTIASGAVLNASAVTKGDGGSIVAWSDISNPLSVTQVGGNLSANGGMLGGNGGAIETSGRLLDIHRIRVSTKSPLGRTGNWLIDPVDTVIQSLSQPNTASTTYISSSTLLSNLATTNYTLSSSDGGNINVNADLTSVSTNTMTLNASGLLNINKNLDMAGNVVLSSTSGGVSLGTGTTTTINNLTINGSLTGSGNIAFRSGVNGDLLISQTFVTPTTYSGNITGNGKLTKSGLGSLNLTGSNTFTGGMTISDGTLIGNTQSLLGNVVNNSNLIFNQSNAGTFAGNISGTGYVGKDGLGVLTLSGVNSYSNGTQIANGTIVGNTQSLFGNIINNAALIFDQSGTGQFAGNISGSGSVTKLGQGNLTLTGTNSYTGGTTVSTASLIGNTQSLTGNIVDNATVIFDQSTNGTFAGNISGTGALLKLGAGSLTLSGRNSYTGGTTITTGTLIGNSQSLTGNIIDNAFLTFDQSNTAVIQSTDAVFAGRISGTGAFTKQGSSSLTLTGENNYQGGTTISAGTLIGNSQSLTGNILNNAALTFDQSGTGQFAANISGSGSFAKLGQGNLTLSGMNSYTGGTTISAGTLTGNAQSLTGNMLNNASLTFDQSGTGQFAGNISGSGSFIKLGQGNLTLTGTNSYTGGTTVSSGSLIGSTQSLTGNIVDNASVIFDQSTNGIFAGNISGTGTLLKLGAGSLTLSGRNSYAGGTTITTGTIIGNSLSLTGNIIDNAFLTFDQSTDAVFAGRISGSGALTKQGSGSLTLSGENNYQGGTTISAGILIGNTQSLTGNIVDNATLIFDQSNTGTFAGNISGSGSVQSRGQGNLTLSGVNTYSGGTTISAGTLIGNTQSLTGNIVDNATLIFDQSTTGTFAGNISGVGSVQSRGQASLTLAGVNNYTGGTTISAGTLIGNTQSLTGNLIDNAALIFDQSINGTFAGSISGSGSLQSRGQGSLTLLGTNNYRGGTLISGGSLVGNTQSLTGNIVNNASLIFDQATDATFNGNISGSGNVIKNNAGKLILAGINNFTGGTITNAGQLQLGLSSTSDSTTPTTKLVSPVPTNFNPAALNFKPPAPMQFAPPPTTSFAGPSGPQILNPNSAGLPPQGPGSRSAGPGPSGVSDVGGTPPPPPGGGQGPAGGQGVAGNPGPGPGGGPVPAGSNPSPNAPPVGGAFVANFIDAGPPPPPSGPNQPSTTGQGPVAQGVESASPAAPPPPPPPLTAKATPSDTPAAGDASLKVSAVAPTYTPPKQNARLSSRVSTTIVANGLALQKTQNIASSITPVLNNNLSIRGNSANW